MAAANYITLSELRDELLLPDNSQDTRLLRAISDSSRAIDAFCKQPQGGFAAQTFTRYFDVAPYLSTIRAPVTDNTRSTGNYVLRVPPLLTVTSLNTDDTGDGTFGSSWTQTTDYFLYPLNEEVKREVATNSDIGRFTFPSGRRRVRIIGTWGITEDGLTPEPIQRATLLLAERYYKRAVNLENNPLAVTSPSKMMIPMDVDIQTIITTWAGKYRMQWLAI